MFVTKPSLLGLASLLVILFCQSEVRGRNYPYFELELVAQGTKFSPRFYDQWYAKTKDRGGKHTVKCICESPAFTALLHIDKEPTDPGFCTTMYHSSASPKVSSFDSPVAQLKARSGKFKWQQSQTFDEYTRVALALPKTVGDKNVKFATNRMGKLNRVNAKLEGEERGYRVYFHKLYFVRGKGPDDRELVDSERQFKQVSWKKMVQLFEPTLRKEKLGWVQFPLNYASRMSYLGSISKTDAGTFFSQYNDDLERLLTDFEAHRAQTPGDSKEYIDVATSACIISQTDFAEEFDSLQRLVALGFENEDAWRESCKAKMESCLSKSKDPWSVRSLMRL